MYVIDFFTNVVEEAKQSFIYGTVSSLVKANINKKENDNILYLQKKAIREGIEYMQFNIVYSSIKYIFSLLKMKNKINNNLCLFLASYYMGLRNGHGFAFKASCVSTGIYLGESLVNLIR